MSRATLQVASLDTEASARRTTSVPIPLTQERLNALSHSKSKRRRLLGPKAPSWHCERISLQTLEALHILWADEWLRIKGSQISQVQKKGPKSEEGQAGRGILFADPSLRHAPVDCDHCGYL
jgi:hypothetical protein